MKLSQLAAKPQLLEVVLDDAETLAEYGEAVVFWTWDRQPLDVFMRLASATSQDSESMLEIVRNLMLDEGGKPIVTKDTMLPTSILVRAIGRLTDSLGK
jgi:hypothetical protein